MMRAQVAVVVAVLGCHRAPPPPDAGVTVGDLADASGSRLKLEWWQTADGARQVRGIFDAQLGIECAMTDWWLDSLVYCLPTDAGFAAYADAGCMQPRVVRDATMPAPRYGLEHVQELCSSGLGVSAVFAAGAPTGETMYYVKQSIFPGQQQCVQVTQPATVYAATVLPIDTFVEAKLEQRSGATSFVATYYGTQDGLVLTRGLHDVADDEDCTASDVPRTGDTLCMPTLFGAASTEFSDPGCTQPTMYAGNGCKVPAFALVQSTTGPCGSFAVERHGAAIAQAYDTSSGTCAPAAPSGTLLALVGGVTSLPSLGKAPGTTPGRRIQTMYVTTPDGLRQHRDLYDTQLGLECAIDASADGTPRCLPIAGSAKDMFLDAACTMATSAYVVGDFVPACANVPPPTPPPFVATRSTGATTISAIAPTAQTFYFKDLGTHACVPELGFAATTVTSLDGFATAAPTVDP
jgi:hypothetical protein